MADVATSTYESISEADLSSSEIIADAISKAETSSVKLGDNDAYLKTSSSSSTGVQIVGSTSGKASSLTLTAKQATAIASATGGNTWKIDFTKAGNSEINLSAANIKAQVSTGSGNDTINAAGLQEGSTIAAGDGNNLLILTSNLASYDSYTDEVIASDGATVEGATIKGGSGRDSVYGGKDNFIYTYAGKDSVWGSLGGNTVDLGSDNDYVAIGKDDTVTLGAGVDTIDLTGGPAGSVSAAGTAYVKDYRYNEDVIQLGDITTAVGSADSVKAIFGSDGTIKDITDGHDGKYAIAPASTSSYYKVMVADSVNGGQDVWYAGDKSGTMSAAGTTTALVMVGNNNDDVGDYIIGGSKKDTIYAGENDSVYGGLGNDDIVLTSSTTREYVGAAGTAGHDTVKGFVGGYTDAADVVYLYDGLNSGAKAKIDSTSNNVVVTGTSSSLDLGTGVAVGTGTGINGFLVTDGSKEIKKVGVVATGATGSVTDDIKDISYYFGDGSTLDASAVTTKVVVDLGNTKKYGTTENYSGITAVVGSSSADNILVGAAGTKNTLTGGVGGDNSLYGGGVSADQLNGSTGAKDVFYYGTGDGNDTVTNYVSSEDVVFAHAGGAVKAIRSGASSAITWSDNSKLTIQSSSTDVNDSIFYTTDGATTKALRIGETNTQNTFIYDADVDIYYGGHSGDTLQVTGSESAQVYLDGRTGQNFTGITVIDGSQSLGSIELAGNDSANTVIGGSGANSVWGGAGAVNDTLVGGAGGNAFYFGMGEGSDVITSSNSSDKVMLYNVNEAQIAGTGVDAAGNMVITLSDNSRLTVQNFSSQGVENFQLADASYTYDKTNGVWVRQ